MTKDEILKKLQLSIEEMDSDLATVAAKEAVAGGLDPFEAITAGLSRGMETISNLFDEGEAFIPELLLASDAFDAAVAIITESLNEEEKKKTVLGKVLMATVEGDIHDIGKNIVKTMLSASGFQVFDLGRDVPTEEVIKKAIEYDVDIIAGSALMTTTMPSQRNIINGLKEVGMRHRFKCMFGGAPVSQNWVEKIGADAYGETAADAISIAKNFMAVKGGQN